VRARPGAGILKCACPREIALWRSTVCMNADRSDILGWFEKRRQSSHDRLPSNSERKQRSGEAKLLCQIGFAEKNCHKRRER
jgi:hypothetical protein